MFASGSSSMTDHVCMDATTQTVQAALEDRKEHQKRHLGVRRLGAIEERAPAAGPNGTACQLFHHCSGSATLCESSCSQRWHRRVTAALCVVGVTVSFVILALGLLFGGGLRRGPRYLWADPNANASSNASAPNSGAKPELPLPIGLNKLDLVATKSCRQNESGRTTKFTTATGTFPRALDSTKPASRNQTLAQGNATASAVSSSKPRALTNSKIIWINYRRPNKSILEKSRAVRHILGSDEHWNATSITTPMGEQNSTTTETAAECTPVEPRLCVDSASDNGPVRQNAFAWNVAQQRCTRVSSDAYCVRGSAAGFFRDVKECSLACGDGEDRGRRPASPEPSVLCPGVDPDAAEVRRCTAEDLLYPAYFDGTGCKEEHQRGQCRYHGREASFQTTEQCKEACLGKDPTDPTSRCNATRPTFECRDHLKKVTARYDADAGRCRPVRMCLDGGYDTISECSRYCRAKAYAMR